MEHRVLGKTGEKVPIIGMGTWAMGNRPSGEERTKELEALRRGIELGMSLIDTAEMYGYGKSERLVAEAIADRRDEVFVATKVSPDHFQYDEMLKSCEASLQRLSVKSIDLYQLHWPNPRVPIKETMRAMEHLVSQGKIRYIGVSNFSVEQTMEAQESLSKNEVASNQVRYSLTSRSIENSLLPFCEREKITVIAYSPLDMGRLPQSRIPKEMLDKYGMTAAQIMLAWVVHRETVIAIPKAAQVKHVEENAEAANVRLSAADYAQLSELFG
jgi:diketogulonate reductase-like aldo/keto reductase